MRTPPGRGQHDRRADPEEGGRVRRVPPHHHGHRGGATRTERAQVRMDAALYI